MAASLSRPDPSSPASVAEAGFTVARRGYQPDEVRAFLVAVAAELGRLQERERALESELRRERTLTRTGQDLDEATVAEMLGEETVRVLQTARESAALIKARAEESAARVLGDAHDEANRLRQEAEVETARRRHDAVADAEAEVALAKQQGREMVNEARAYRERVLADLERRTNLARQQIEDLLGGRDRLLQAFERARLVALDVTSTLQSVELPEERVDLTPTTGPVPVMVPVARPAPVEPDHLERDAPEPAPVVDPEEPSVDSAPTDVATVESDLVVDDEVVEALADADPMLADVVDVETDVETDVDTDVETDVDDVETDVVDDDTEDASDDAHDEPATAGNVVVLFRGREHLRTNHESEEPDTPDVEPDAVSDTDPLDGLFARLRSELPATESVTVPTTEPVPTAGEELADDRGSTTAFGRRDETLVPLIVSAARKLKRALADEQNVVLDALRRRTPYTSIDQLLPGPDDHLAAYSSAIDEELADSMVAGAAEVGHADGRALRARLSGAGAPEAAVAVLRSALVAPLRDRIERAVVEGDGDNEAITQRVRSIYREWKTQHIDTEIDDVLRVAFCGGLISSIEPGTRIVWRIDPSVVACPECEDNSLSEAVRSGSPFPTGHVAPPAHPGCRCLVVPVD